MSDYSDMVSLFRRVGIVFEEKEFTVMQGIYLTADEVKIFGCLDGFVEFKFTREGAFCHVGIYPRRTGGVVSAPAPVLAGDPPPLCLPKEMIPRSQKIINDDLAEKSRDDLEGDHRGDKIISGNGTRKKKMISPPPIRPKVKIDYDALARGIDESLKQKDDLTSLFSQYRREKK